MTSRRDLWQVMLVRVLGTSALYGLAVFLFPTGISRSIALLAAIVLVCQPLVTISLSCASVSVLLSRAAAVARLALVYAVPSMLFFVPLIGRLGTEILGSSDSLQTLWNAWWVKQAFLSGRPLFFSDVVYAPVGAPLVFHTLIPIQSTLIALLTPILGEVAAYNGIAFLAFPLAGIGAYALCRAIGFQNSACIVAGFVFAWSPFLTSKLQWLNMAHCGFLALFAAALVRTISLEGKPATQESIAMLALASVAVQFSGDVTAVFAANLVFVRLLACVLNQRAIRQPLRQMVRAFAPTVIVLTPYLIIALSHLPAFWGSISRELGAREFIPDPVIYLMPVTIWSVHAGMVESLIGRVDPALTRSAGLVCYLGVLVLPMAIMGWYAGRNRPELRFWTAVFVLFLSLSVGPYLYFHREPIQVLGHNVWLPFAFWSRLPVLGAVSASTRYMVLAYMAMSVGIAAWISSRSSNLRKASPALILGAVLIIGVDYAFVPRLHRIPQIPPVANRPGAVMETRIYRGETMYYQTKHQRPMVGGYLARPVRAAIRTYRRSPCTQWLMGSRNETAPCDAVSMKDALTSFDVTDVFMDPGDPRRFEMMRLGFKRLSEDPNATVWTLAP